MKYKHLLAFEEYDHDSIKNDTNVELGNPFDQKELITKLHLYASASSSIITEITSRDKSLSFDIFTKIPSDKRSFGTKFFRVIVPVDLEATKIITYEGNNHSGYKPILDTHLEVSGENDFSIILKNFIEATQLFDDTVIQRIVDVYDKISTPEELRNIINSP